MGQSCIEIVRFKNQCKRVIFLLLLILPFSSFGQKSYTSQWFSRYDDPSIANEQHKDLLLPDTPNNAWHNALVSFDLKITQKPTIIYLKTLDQMIT